MSHFSQIAREHIQNFKASTFTNLGKLNESMNLLRNIYNVNNWNTISLTLLFNG